MIEPDLKVHVHFNLSIITIIMVLIVRLKVFERGNFVFSNIKAEGERHYRDDADIFSRPDTANFGYFFTSRGVLACFLGCVDIFDFPCLQSQPFCARQSVNHLTFGF